LVSVHAYQREHWGVIEVDALEQLSEWLPVDDGSRLIRGSAIAELELLEETLPQEPTTVEELEAMPIEQLKKLAGEAPTTSC
jgi:hypothetical protein